MKTLSDTINESFEINEANDELKIDKSKYVKNNNAYIDAKGIKLQVPYILPGAIAVTQNYTEKNVWNAPKEIQKKAQDIQKELNDFISDETLKLAEKIAKKAQQSAKELDALIK